MEEKGPRGSSKGQKTGRAFHGKKWTEQERNCPLGSRSKQGVYLM